MKFISNTYEACEPDQRICKNSILYDLLKPGNGVKTEKAFWIKEYLRFCYYSLAVSPSAQVKSYEICCVQGDERNCKFEATGWRWIQIQQHTNFPCFKINCANNFVTTAKVTYQQKIVILEPQTSQTKNHHCLKAFLVPQVSPDICINPLKVIWQVLPLRAHCCLLLLSF